MLTCRLSRIVATLFHRALFLLLADIVAGPEWFLINNFTGLIDFVFGADFEYLWNYQNFKLTLSWTGFVILWWMVHFLPTKQLWYNGVLLELFVLVQILGYLSNQAYVTPNPYHPILIAAFVHLLLILYRRCVTQLRGFDPEQSLYRFSQLRKPFVPNRALQLIQITPLCYAILARVPKHLVDPASIQRMRYSLGMADAIVYAGINMDLVLVILTRLIGTCREAYLSFNIRQLAWLFRVNITGSYTMLIKDLGWRSVPADQLHMSWLIYWVLKILLVSILWTQIPIDKSKPTYFIYLAQQLSNSFVAGTATVYFSCLISSTLITLVAALCTMSADLVPKNNVLQSCFDTVQHIRWNTFPWKVEPHRRVFVIIHAVLFGHIPLCGKIAQTVGRTTRGACHCKTRNWLGVLGGICVLVGLLCYSFIVYNIIDINIPHVSKCFAKQISQQMVIWIIYNTVVSIVEVTAIFIHQGLLGIGSQRSLERVTSFVRTFLTSVLAVLLTVVNIMGFVDALSAQGKSCGYKDIAHNLVQILARISFIYITLQTRSTSQALRQIRNVESVTYRKKSDISLLAGMETSETQCGLCYERSNTLEVTKLDTCGHSFHLKCFSAWMRFGYRCPVCSAVFRRTELEGPKCE